MNKMDQMRNLVASKSDHDASPLIDDDKATSSSTGMGFSDTSTVATSATSGHFMCDLKDNSSNDVNRRPCSTTKKIDLELSGSCRPFYGRKQELDRLGKLYEDHLCSSDSDAWPTERAVLIQGAPGVGKTALVQRFVSDQLPGQMSSNNDVAAAAAPEAPPLILNGKYEEMTRQDPFSAIEHAFGNYFRSEISHAVADPENLDRGCSKGRRKIFKTIGGEAGLDVLRGVLPALGGWLTLNQPSTPVEESDVSQSSEQSCCATSRCSITCCRGPSTSKSHQLHYVFGRLVQALTTEVTETTRPLVLVLDNLQHADAASLDLLVYLIKQNIPHFFFIGMARGEDQKKEAVDHDDTGIDSCPSNLRRLADYCHKLFLENHKSEEVAALIAQEIPCSDDNDCEALARVVYDKTKGNILFTLHLIDELRQQRRQPQGRESNNNATGRDLLSTRSWHGEEIFQCIKQTRVHTIGDVVSDKICHLTNPHVRLALMVASYLGSQFTVSNLQALCSHINDTYHDPASIEEEEEEECPADQDNMVPLLSVKNLVQLLDVAVLEGLLYNPVGSMTYQFTHDGIQEAAYNMIPAGPQRDQMLYQVGLFLKEEAPYHDSEDWMLFVAARHWSKIQQAGTLVDHLELARLYLRCGKKAIARAAYEEASRWLKEGLKSLNFSEGIELWKDHYELTLHLHRSAAEAELLLGNYEIGYRYGGLVLEHAKNLLDKMPTYSAFDTALGLQDRHDEALKLNMEVLTELNQVPTTFMAIRDFFQVKGLIRDTTDDEILSLPEAKDPYYLAAARCLQAASVRAYCSGKMLLMMAITLRQVKLTLQFGLSPESPLIFAGYGVSLISGMGHPNTGVRMGRIARHLASQPGYNEHECQTLYIVTSFIEIWTVPFDTAIQTYERAYEVGLMSAMHDFGFGAELDGLITSFIAGRSLESISQRLQKFRKETDQYSLDALKKVLEPFSDLVLHLAGQQPRRLGSKVCNTCCIDWEALDIQEEIRADKSNHFTLSWALLDRMILAFFMDNMPFAEQMMKKFHGIAPSQSFFSLTLGSFFSALVCAKLAHNSRYSKHKTLAQKYTKEMKKLVDKGCTKNAHKYDLLKAECMSLNRGQNQEKVQRAYDTAIASAKESGCRNDHALANELAGDFFLRQMHPHLAKCYLVKACSIYMEWGALKKVEQLLRKHGLTKDDLPLATTSANDENFQPDLYPTINLGSPGGGSVCDEISALTTIPENSALLVSNRWENGGTAKRAMSSCPPKPPRRRDTCSCPSKPPRRPSRPDETPVTAA